MVYVISSNGHPLMPTTRYGKVRHLLNSGHAKVITRCPFTIKLLYESTTHVQAVVLGVDAGSKTMGLSAVTEKKELFASEVTLRNDIVELLSTRREARRSRRNRKTRYREARFNNRISSKNKGWLAPSVEHKIQSHLTVIENVHKILPVTKIVIETASFDSQKIKAIQAGNPVPKGTDYQEGDMLGFWNIREYVLWRDGHKCRNPKCKYGKILNVHHIESRKTGGDSPGNLVTLCEECHKLYHEGKLDLKIKRGKSYRDAAFMGIMRWTVYNRLKSLYPDVKMTYGYLTKHIRITHKLPKSHYIDARCISGRPDVSPASEVFYQKKVRCHNRQINKFKVQKGGARKNNQAPRRINGFQLFDKVRFQDQECFIFGRRISGYFDLRLLDGTKVNPAVSYKKLVLLEHRKSYLTERRPAFLSSMNWRVSTPKFNENERFYCNLGDSEFYQQEVTAEDGCEDGEEN